MSAYPFRRKGTEESAIENTSPLKDNLNPEKAEPETGGAEVGHEAEEV